MQSGATSVSKSRDGTTGYVPIILDHTITRPASGADIRSYLIVRTFSLSGGGGGGGGGGSGNSPSAASGSTATSAPSASSASDVSSPSLNAAVSMSLSGTFLIPILPGATGQPVPASIAAGGGDPAMGSTGNGGSGERVSKAGIIGGILGGLVLSGVFALVFFLLYKRKMREVQKREEEQQQQPTAVILPETVVGGGGGDEGGAGDGIQMRLSSMVEIGLPQSEAPSERANGYPFPGQYHDTKTTGSTSAMSSSYLTRPSETQQTSTSQLTGEEERQRRWRGNERGKKRSDGRNEGNGRGGETISSGYSSPIDTPGMDVPPPAYTDVNEMVETMNGRHYNEGEEGESDERK
ncbi:hypothetical protein FRC17_003751 [Serendipita sp. 399]|nr:hypothetical protein FRC17_003751 [Serendipita sp. 399]